jgi:hypothetical protein
MSDALLEAPMNDRGQSRGRRGRWLRRVLSSAGIAGLLGLPSAALATEAGDELVAANRTALDARVLAVRSAILAAGPDQAAGAANDAGSVAQWFNWPNWNNWNNWPNWGNWGNWGNWFNR